MVSTFDQAFQNAQDKLYDINGISATYNSESVTICLNGYDTTIEQYPEVWVAAATIEIRTSEIANPSRGDIVTFNGITYQVGEVLSGDNLHWVLALTKQMVRI